MRSASVSERGSMGFSPLNFRLAPRTSRAATDSRLSILGIQSRRRVVVSASGISLSPRGRQSFAPLTAPRLGQVLERGSLCFEPMEDLEGGSPLLAALNRRGLCDILQRSAQIHNVNR